jgi:hypothetical protein
VPGAGDGEGDNKEEDENEPEGLDFLRRAARLSSRIKQLFAAIQGFGHEFIVAEGQRHHGGCLIRGEARCTPICGEAYGLRGITISTRRFMARPSAVSLPAIGRYSP